ncbi:hypothetical protein ACWIE6_19215 [Paenibacillus taichungensis]
MGKNTHVGIERGNPHWPNEKRELLQENIYIISNDAIDFDNLPNLPRIYYKTDPAHSMLIDNWWKSVFPDPPLFRMKVDNMEIAKRMTQNGLGYSIVSGKLKNTEGVPLIWTTWLLFLKESLKLTSVKAFVEFITHHYSQRNLTK